MDRNELQAKTHYIKNVNFKNFLYFSDPNYTSITSPSLIIQDFLDFPIYFCRITDKFIQYIHWMIEELSGLSCTITNKEIVGDVDDVTYLKKIRISLFRYIKVVEALE